MIHSFKIEMCELYIDIYHCLVIVNAHELAP